MKNIVQKAVFSIIYCSICLCTYATNGMHGAETLYAQLYNGADNYDNGQNTQRQPNDTAANMGKDSLATQVDSTVVDKGASKSKAESFGGGMSAFDWMSILALIMSVYVLYKSRKSEKGNQEAPAFSGEAEKLSGEIIELKKRIAEITRCINAVPFGQNTSPQVAVSSQAEPQKLEPMPNVHIKPKEKTLYATIIKGETFLEMGIKDTADDFTVCILTTVGDNGTFAVNGNPVAQQNILSKLNYGLSNVVVIKSKSLSPKCIRTIKAGKIRRVGKDWLVTDKAEIELC